MLILGDTVEDVDLFHSVPFHVSLDHIQIRMVELDVPQKDQVFMIRAACLQSLVLKQELGLPQMIPYVNLS